MLQNTVVELKVPKWGREREREREGIDTTSDMRIESKKAHLLHKVLKLWEEFFCFG